MCSASLANFESVLCTGDYWPGEAENLLGNISEEQRQAGRKGNKGSLTAGGKPRAKSAKVSLLHLQETHPCINWIINRADGSATLT